MPTQTYTPIATYTIPSTTASYTFTAISNAYTDLKIIIVGMASAVGRTVKVQFNGDTTSGLYSMTELWATGSGSGSNRRTGQNQINTSYQQVNFSDTAQANAIIDVMNYSNSTTFKTLIARTNSATASYPGTAASVGLWRNTAAITSITITADDFITGSTFTLYGIKAGS